QKVRQDVRLRDEVRVEGVALEDHSDAPVAGANLPHVDVVVAHVARIRRDQPGDELQQRGLATPARSQDDQGPAIGNPETQILDGLGIPAGAKMNTAIYDVAPDIPARLRARGDEILGHGVTNSDEQGHLGEDQERALIQTVTATIARHEGSPPIGWMSPWLSNSAATMDLLQEAGYRYVMDWTMDDQPIWIRTRKGRLLAIPYPIEVHDTRGIVWYHYTADEFAEMIVDQFDELLAQSARQPLVCPISLHPFVIGRPYRLRRLRRALQHILGHGERVWLTRPRDICAHVESLPPGVVPGSAT